MVVFSFDLSVDASGENMVKHVVRNEEVASDNFMPSHLHLQRSVEKLPFISFDALQHLFFIFFQRRLGFGDIELPRTFVVLWFLEHRLLNCTA